MLSPISGIVLLLAALVASPALWAAFVEGTMPVDAALTRYLVVVLVTWACLSLISTYAWAPRKPALIPDAKPTPKQDGPRSDDAIRPRGSD